MKANKIDAYYSGCLTLTLQKSPDIKKEDIANIKTSKNHIKLRNDLIKRCKKFTGFDNSKSIIPNISNIQEEVLFNLMTNKNTGNTKILFGISISLLIKNIYTRIILGKK